MKTQAETVSMDTSRHAFNDESKKNSQADSEAAFNSQDSDDEKEKISATISDSIVRKLLLLVVLFVVQ